MKDMSRLYARGLSSPTVAIICRELGRRGRREMSSFQGLSGGKTWRAARMRSASGVLNITGPRIAGIGGRSRPLAGGAPRSTPGIPISPIPQSNAHDHDLMAHLRDRRYDDSI